MAASSAGDRAGSRESSPIEFDVVVIGAGAAGLAAARLLEQGALRVRVIEQGERCGESWWQRYEGLRLNTVRWLSDLPLRRMPRDLGRWPAREKWASYLESYAQDLNDVRFGVSARRVERAGGGWTVETDAGSMSSRYVVIATGHDRVPVIPDWPGEDSFSGRLMHSSEFRRPEDLSGREVLVVGTGNSGAEIAAILAADPSKRVAISVRTPPLILRRDIGGVPVTLLGELGRLAPDSWIDWAGKRIHRLLWGDLEPFGLKAPEKQLSAMRHTYYSPPLDSGFIDAIKGGAIEVVGAVRSFDSDRVVLEDGKTRTPDVVIAATGFRPGLEPLVGHLGLLDDEGEPLLEQAARQGIFCAGFRFGLLALLPYLEGDAVGIARSIGVSASAPRIERLRRPLKLRGIRP